MALAEGFVYLHDIDASIMVNMRYFTQENFLGRNVKGYESPRCILTADAAHAITKVQQLLKPLSLGLKIFDGYRPQQAVNDFIAWSRDPLDQKMKQQYYPNIDKADLFKLNYLAKKSGHSRGSTIDLTIIHISSYNKKITELTMGTEFDFMDELSHTLSPLIQGEAHQNRILLRDLMITAGFKPIATEWWHFTLENEPFPDTYFDFPVL